MRFCASAFLAALAFAMLSLRALEDFETFLVSNSDCCSGVKSDAVDRADGDRGPTDDCLDVGSFGCALRVFFTSRLDNDASGPDPAAFMWV